MLLESDVVTVRAAAVALVGLILAAAARATEPDFRWFDSLAGSCWVATFPDGRTVHTQCYTRQFGKFMRGSARLESEREGQRSTQFEGDSMFAWDQSTRKIAYFIWGSNGSYRQLDAHCVDEELFFPVPGRTDPTQIAYRSVWRRMGENSFEVRRERLSAGAWGVDVKVVYRKDQQSPGNGSR